MDINGSRFAVKRFAAAARVTWAREVASHSTLSLPEVIALKSYGVDKGGRGWLCTPWIDANNARTRVAAGDNGVQGAAKQWTAQFQQDLQVYGYRWADPALRNLLVLGSGSHLSPYAFRVVDFTVCALRESDELEGKVQHVLRLQPGDRRDLMLPRSGHHSGA